MNHQTNNKLFTYYYQLYSKSSFIIAVAVVVLQQFHYQFLYPIIIPLLLPLLIQLRHRLRHVHQLCLILYVNVYVTQSILTPLTCYFQRQRRITTIIINIFSYSYCMLNENTPSRFCEEFIIYYLFLLFKFKLYTLLYPWS